MKLILEVKVKAKDGIPTMFLTASKDGKAFDVLYSSEMALSEIFKRFDAMSVEVNEERMPESTQDLMDYVIRIGSLVKCIAKVDPESESELNNGGIYQVVALSGDQLDIIDRKTRHRMTVMKEDVEFYQKGKKAEPKVTVFETLKNCTCGEQVVLQKIDGEYFGKCACGIEITQGITA